AVKELIKKPFKEALDWVMEYYNKVAAKIKAVKDFFTGNKDAEESTFGLSDDDLKSIQSSVMAGSGGFIGNSIANAANNSSPMGTQYGNVTIHQSVAGGSSEVVAQRSVDGFSKALKAAGYNTKNQLVNGVG
ncbi:hypothetical protein KKJ02_19440, partial [Xenorhabdus bovienii]|nr:hypothetical protein [Xenorhabdus bovienii]